MDLAFPQSCYSQRNETASCYTHLACMQVLMTPHVTQVSIMAAIRHPNVVLLMGLCLNPVCVVSEFCARGSLSDVIKKAATSKIFA